MSNLRDTARQYRAWGASVNAIKNGTKKTLNKWKELYETPQTLDQIESYPWDRAGGIGILNGLGGWHTYDIDAPKDAAHKPLCIVTEDAIDSLLDQLQLPPDYPWGWRGASKAGWGLAFSCDEPLPAGVMETKRDEAGVAWGWPAKDSGADWDHLELRYTSCQTVYPPSDGYSWRYDAPTEAPSVVPIHRVISAFFALCPPKTHTLGSVDRAVIDQIRDRFDLVEYAVQTFGGDVQAEGHEIRVTGHGGMLINPEQHIWNCFSDDIGGDCFDLVAYGDYRTTARNLNGKSAEVLAKTAAFAGVTIPQRAPTQLTQQVIPETGELPVPSAMVMRGLAALGYTFRLNECDNVIEVNGKKLDDFIEAEIVTGAWDANIKPKGLIKPAYITDAVQHAYHPVSDYLTGLQWDGADHITALASHLHSDDPPIVYEDGTRARLCAVYLKRWLVGAVAKALDRKQNVMLVLAGPQNIGKSALAKWLCSGIPDRFIEGPIRVEDKDSSVRLMSRFIWEVSELDATTRRSDVSALKDFITRDEVTVRKAYGRHDTIAPAMSSMIGTVNECAGFLSDESGNRRFMVTSISSIDWGYTKIDVNQLWAQAVALYRAGEPWRLTPRESKEQATRNQSYDVESALDGWLPKWFDLAAGPNELMTSADIIDHLRAKDIHLSGNERAQAMEISRILARHNVEKVRTNSWRGYRGIAPRDNPVTTYQAQVVTENSAPQSHNDNVTTYDNLPNTFNNDKQAPILDENGETEKSTLIENAVTGRHVVTNAVASGQSGDDLAREVVTNDMTEVVTDTAFRVIPARPLGVNERLAKKRQVEDAELAEISAADEDMF